MDFLINKKLKIFITLMETCSFSIATSVLYITRTPLSRVISDLERELKQRLFIRKNGTLIPTEFAQTIYRKVKSHYIFLHALEQEIGPTGKTKQLEIIFDEIYPESLKNLIISALTISGQKTNIMGRAVNSQIIEELCQTNNCIVISARNYFHRESLVCRTSVEGGVMLFIPKKFFLCGKPDINRLAGTPVLFHEGAKNFNLDTIYHFFKQTLGITNPAFSFDNVDLFSSLYRLQQGLAMLLIPVRVCRALGLSTDHALHIKGVALCTSLYYPTKKRETPDYRKAIKLIQQELKQSTF